MDQPEMLGRYRLVRQLAQGGMAEIFVAKQVGPEGFERTAVIKRVLPGLATDADFVQMFLDEARISAALSHPNLVQVFDFGHVDGAYFFAMEYLPGEDLRAIAAQAKERGQRIPAHIAALIVAAACDGLHYAHTLTDESGRPLGLVHRDVTPSNIFVTYQGGVKVLDFGIAKAESRIGRTQPGVIKGKRLYMSPEQVLGQKVDGRSDVFSLGLVLFELLTGERATHGRGDVEVMKSILSEPFPNPSRLRSDLPVRLDGIVLKALERDPLRRYPSAAELRQALDGFLADYTYHSHAEQLQAFLRGLFDEEHIRGRSVTAADAGEHPTLPSGVSAPHKSETLELSPLPALPPTPPAPPPVVAKATNRLALVAFALLPIAVAATAFLVRTPQPSPELAPPIHDAVAAIDAGAAIAEEPRPAVAVDAGAAERPHRAKPPERFGALQVNCLPWCRVFLDGQDTRQVSPTGDIRVPAGRHRVRVISPALGRELERWVVIAPGERARESFQFP
jgi:serine/threonine protein kinase